MSLLDWMHKLMLGQVPPPPIVATLGMELRDADKGRATFELQASKRFANPMGTLHGGIICDLADAAMGFAFASTLDEGESFTTLDLTSKFFKPVWESKLTAVAKVTKRTHTLGLIECEVTDEGGSLVAKVFSTCMVLRGEAAKGR